MEQRSGHSSRAVRAVVSGRVQGVWYRAHTERRARELGLCGTVENLPDGTVEIVAEGDASSIDQLLEWAWSGSPLSEVGSVEVEDLSLAGRRGFSVRY
jgi:acylphosphatase